MNRSLPRSGHRARRPWSTATDRRIATLAGPSGLGVYGVAFSPDGKIVATANLNGVTYLWGIATGRTRR
ncbi:MAG: hypothetical protein WB800_35740 [Streptosporangiaceae bacterium]